MAVTGFSTKYELISKDQTRTVLVAATAAVIVVMCFVYINSLFAKMDHQGLIITKQEEALKVLEDNQEALQGLESSFDKFIASDQPATRADKTNLDTVRDALPSVYNYPNLFVAMENLFSTAGYTARANVSNQEEEVTQTSTNPTPEELPISFSFTASEDDWGDIFDRLRRSIRPIQVKIIDVTRENNEAKDMNVQVEAATYFLPKKSLDIVTEEIE